MLLEKQVGISVQTFEHARLRRTIPVQPYPRLARAGLLALNEKRDSFILPPALQDALQDPIARDRIRTLAIDRLAKHYSEPGELIGDLVKQSIEA